MNISELLPNQRIDFLDATVKDISPIKEFSKFGKMGKVISATIKDYSGEITMVLWDEQIDLIKKEDRIRITNCYVKEWNGEKQINLGRIGTIEITNY